MSRLAIAFLLIAALSACERVSNLFGRSGDSQGYYLPLTVELRFDPSATEAALAYNDACGQPQRLAIGDRFVAAATREMGLAFEHVVAPPEKAPLPAGPLSSPPDGVVTLDLGLKEIDLFIPRRAAKSYPAVVTVGASMVYYDAEGNAIYTKNLKTTARGTVETNDQDCQVKGVAVVAAEAIGILSQGLKKNVATAVKVREQAAKGKKERNTAAASSSPGGTGQTAAPTATVPSVLTFRAMLSSAQKKDRLEAGDTLSIAVEITNTGATTARGMVLRVVGSPDLAAQFHSPVALGDLQPNETMRRELTATIPTAATPAQAELLVALEAANAASPDQKRFLVEWAPAPTRMAKAVEVDDIPAGAGRFKRPKGAGVSIGVGTFRSASVERVEFAAHDAEVMGRYFEGFAGIPSSRIKVLTDEHALKDDVVEVIEEWLPQAVEAGGEVLVFIAARAVVNPSSGAVSLIPHEADPDHPVRLYSLRRLHDALARLPMQRAIVMLDLTLMAPDSTKSPDRKGPSWEPAHAQLKGDKLVQIVGVRGHQEAHQFDEGGHGLFTYYLLKGLRGHADRDDNGVVALGELCGYVHDEVLKTAKEKYQNAQEPVCLPALSAKKASAIPLTQLR
jgi:hypothetical protein